MRLAEVACKVNRGLGRVRYGLKPPQAGWRKGADDRGGGAH
jgi:hypothetical protein